MAVTALQLTQLRKALPHGAIRKIHERLAKKNINVSYEVVAHVIRGRYYKEEVIDEAFRFLSDYRAQENRKEKKLSQQLSALQN